MRAAALPVRSDFLELDRSMRAARSARGQAVAGVDAARLGVDLGDQRLGIGRAQLGELAPCRARARR